MKARKILKALERAVWNNKWRKLFHNSKLYKPEQKERWRAQTDCWERQRRYWKYKRKFNHKNKCLHEYEF